jgi:uncharacterized protein YraI
MSLRTLIAVAGLVAATLAIPQAADAGWGNATVNVVLRTGPGTGYDRVVVIPYGARVEVYRCKGWCEVKYAGHRGWAYGGCIRLAPTKHAATLFVTPVKTRHGTYLSPVWVPPAPAYLASSQYQPPSIDRAYWFEGRTFYYDGRYFDRPDTFHILGR